MQQSELHKRTFRWKSTHRWLIASILAVLTWAIAFWQRPDSLKLLDVADVELKLHYDTKKFLISDQPKCTIKVLSYFDKSAKFHSEDFLAEKRLTLPESNVPYTYNIELSPSLITRRPRFSKVHGIHQKNIEVKIIPYVKKEIPVHVSYSGRNPEHTTVRLETEPQTVIIRGLADSPSCAKTEFELPPVILPPGQKTSFTLAIPIVPAEKNTHIYAPARPKNQADDSASPADKPLKELTHILVHVLYTNNDAQPKTEVTRLSQEVELLLSPSSRLCPAAPLPPVDIQLRTNATDGTLSQIRPYVNLLNCKTPGKYFLPVQLLNLPAETEGKTIPGGLEIELIPVPETFIP